MNVGRGYVIQNNESVSEGVTKVGIELLGQLKTVFFLEIIPIQDSISPPIPKCFQGKLLANWIRRVTYSPIYCLNKYPKIVLK